MKLEGIILTLFAIDSPVITNRIKKIYSAKSSLRVKLFAGFIGLSLILSVCLGYTLYKVSNSIYYKSFLQHNKSLGISIANGIDGRIFQTFINEKSTELPEFKRYLTYLRNVAANEEYITWIYSVIIDKKTDRLIYAIDATPIPEDTIWLENKFIGLKVYINRTGRLSVFWDSTERTSDFTIKNKNKIFRVEIDSSTDELKINDRKILKVVNRSPFVVETEKGIISKENPAQTIGLNLEEGIIPVSLNFASKNSLASIPGWEFIETEELTNKIKSSIHTCTFHMQNEPEQSAYGTFIIVTAPIFINSSECIGAVLFSVSTLDIQLFNNTMAMAGTTITVVALIFTLIVSYILSIYFTDPLHKLSQAVDELSSGNMETNVIIESKDEFGFLSEKFNEMVVNLKKSIQRKRVISRTQA